MTSPSSAPVRALIAEDEPLLAAALARTLAAVWPALQLEPLAENGVRAVEQIFSSRPDLVFLDINMPGKSGLEVAREMAEEWPQEYPFPLLVFVTAYDQYAVQAFDLAAIDYVLKPVSEMRLSDTVGRLQARLATTGGDRELQQAIGQLRQLHQVAAAPEKLNMIRAAVGNQVRLIPVADVLYFEATDKYINVVTANSESLIRTSLKELIPQLDASQFWQIHRSTVVRIQAVSAAQRGDSGKLTLTLHARPETLTVSRLFAHLFRQM
ncbi:LytR/AlgR family response regulator transcription factor [Herbaspirillum autotrophicum]|uniref:LytR/AlgR family response regulator transcription factor n=1 Tax=Herbaspirillum autotrophicum TaxID=180195 RepID=UPI00067D366F|nr:LytTR family DNA-binding domain-containing protein [Herbaspirillum autotrophicum]